MGEGRGRRGGLIQFVGLRWMDLPSSAFVETISKVDRAMQKSKETYVGVGVNGESR